MWMWWGKRQRDMSEAFCQVHEMIEREGLDYGRIYPVEFVWHGAATWYKPWTWGDGKWSFRIVEVVEPANWGEAQQWAEMRSR